MDRRKIAAIALVTLVALLAVWSTLVYAPRTAGHLESGPGERPEPGLSTQDTSPEAFRARPADHPPTRQDASSGDATSATADPVSADPVSANGAAPARPASIAGHVLDADGTAIAGASVQLEVTPNTADMETGIYSATTAKDGSYVIPSITHFGAVLIGASAPGFAAIHTGEFMEHFGAPSIAWVAEGGQHTSVDFTLYAAVAQIRGHVLTPTREGAPDARVIVAKQSCKQGTQGAYWTLSGVNGAFEIDLPCATPCVLVACKAGFGPGYLADVVPGAGSIEITLQGGGAIVGSVQDSKGEPVPGLKIVVAPELPEADANPWDAPNPITVESQDDGSYAARDLSAEFTYMVRAPYPQEKPPQLPATGHSMAEFIRFKEPIAYSYNRQRLRPDSAAPSVMAEVRNVVVRAGHDTRVDLLVGDKDGLPATIHGRITDSKTGQPGGPFLIYALAPGIAAFAESGGIVCMAVSQEDGSYRMLGYGLTEPTPVSVRINYCYSADDSFTFAQAHDATIIRDIILGPGDVQEVNFATGALVTVPVRVVSSSGEPIQGAEVSSVISDAEGRLTLYGLPPNVAHQLRAWWDDPLHRLLLLGISESFSGAPGETVPEVVITCPAPGSLIGQLILPEGMTENPTGEILPCRLHYPDLGTLFLRAIVSPDGTVRVPVAQPGACTAEFILVSLEDDNADQVAIIENVLIESGQETNIGIIAPGPPGPAQ